MEKTKSKLSSILLNMFGLGDFGFQFCASMEIYYFSLFLTDYCKFAPEIAGLILSVTAIVDILWVVVAGVIVQKSSFKWMKWGKHRSWLIFGPPITYLTFIFQFLFIKGPIGPYIIGFGFIASHLIWNVVYTAHISLINVMTDAPYERTKLSTSRQVWTTISRIIFGYVVLNFVNSVAGNSSATTSPKNPMGFTLAVLLFPLIMIVGYYVVFLLTKGHDIDAHLPKNVKAKEPKEPLLSLIVDTLKNTQLLVLILADFFRNLSFFLVSGAAIYFFLKVFQDNKNWAIYLVIINITGFVGTLIAAPVAKRLGKKLTYVAGVACYAVCLLLIYLFASTDIFFIVAMSLGNMLLQFSTCMITAMFADTVTYGEWKTGHNLRGFIMGLFSMPIKISIFARGAIIGAILAAIHYLPNTPPTEAEISGIKTLTALIPAASCIAAALIIFFLYTLTDDKLVKLTEEIKARKSIPQGKDSYKA